MNTIINNLSNSLSPTRDTQTGLLVAGRSVTAIVSAIDLISGTILNKSTDMVAWTIHDGGVIVTFDGTTPTASNGHLLASGTSGEWSKTTSEDVKVLRATVDARIALSEFQTR